MIKGVQQKKCIPFSQFGYFLFSRAFYAEAANLLRKHVYDVIICDYGLSALYGMILSQKFNLPFIYCSHNVEYLSYLDKIIQDRRRLFFVPYIYLVEKAGVKRSKIVVAITESDAEHYTRWTTRDKILVIPQGFDEAVYNPFYEPYHNDPQIVLFCGNYNIQSNREVIDIVMERILEKVLVSCPNTIFRFIGANPPKNVRHTNVEFTGFVEDYAAILKQADVFISPMKQGQGSPTKIFEALACGKQIIATEKGVRSLERDYQSLQVCDLKQFPEKICQALKSGPSVTEADFSKLKSRYSWQTNINRLVKKIAKI